MNNKCLVQLWLVALLVRASAKPARGRPTRLPPECAQYSDLWTSGPAPDNLRYWQDVGVTPAMAGNATLRWGSTPQQVRNGLLYAFLGGRAHVLPPRNLAEVHQATLHLPYMKLFLHMEEVYGRGGAEADGAYLPDVDFLLTTDDNLVPMRRVAANDTARLERLPAPQFRYGKNNASLDLLFPNFHFGLKRFDSDLLARAPLLEARHPWAERKPVAFGRYASYRRVTAGARERLGANGTSICAHGGCGVREHFVQWAARYAPPKRPTTHQAQAGAGAGAKADGDHPGAADGTLRGWWIDVSLRGRVALTAHAAYRYLVHLDGVALSSRLEQLLTLGSLVVKEESGHYAFFHHLLRPHEHYLPFWQQGSGPEDIVPMLDWAVKHDAEARRIAHAGQAFAVRYLNAQARHCYVLWLLQGYASSLRYQPPQPRFAPDLVPLGEYVRKHVLTNAAFARVYNETDF